MKLATCCLVITSSQSLPVQINGCVMILQHYRWKYMYFLTKVVNATVHIDVSNPFDEPLDQFPHPAVRSSSLLGLGTIDVCNHNKKKL